MLRYTADLRSLAFVATYFALIVAAYAFDLPVWGWVGLSATLCLFAFFCAVIAHNTIHAPIFRSKTLNGVFQAALSLTYGHPVSMFVPGHNLSHHKYTQQPRDRMRTDKLRYRWNLLNQVLFSFTVSPAIFKDNARFAAIMKQKKPQWYRQFLFEAILYVTFLVVLFALDWKKFLVFVLIPHQYAAWGIVGINFVQHEGCDGSHPYDHSRNFDGRLLNWFVFNNGFHGIHHMRPGLHWSLLREAHEKQLRPHLHPALDRRSLFAYAFKAYIWPGKRMTFDGKPVVLGPPRQDEDWLPAAARTEIDIYDADFIPGPSPS